MTDITKILLRTIRKMREDNDFILFTYEKYNRLYPELIKNSIDFLEKNKNIKLFKIPIAPDNVYMYIDSKKQIWLLYQKKTQIHLIKYNF
jgi:hypothetical protein